MSRNSAFRLSFSQSVNEISQCVQYALQNDVGQLTHLHSFEDCVYLKNAAGTLKFVNEAYSKVFAAGDSPIGHSASEFLDASVTHTSLHTDALVLAGTSYVECEHIGALADGQMFILQTQKRSLRSFGHPDYVILGVTRPLRPIADEDSAAYRLDAKRLYDAFKALSEQDQEICRLVSLGTSSPQIGEQLGMTPRNVEIRRKKALAALGMEKPMDLAKALVRLEERGYMDLGL